MRKREEEREGKRERKRERRKGGERVISLDTVTSKCEAWKAQLPIH